MNKGIEAFPAPRPAVSPAELGPQYDLSGESGTATRNSIIAGALVATAGAVGLYFGIARGGGNSPSAEAAMTAPGNSQEAARMCNNLTFADAAANANEYNAQAFLPRTDGKVVDKNAVPGYINRLFSSKGPLAGRGDLGSLAAVKAVIVDPSHDGAAADPNYVYKSDFALNVAGYSNSNGGLAAARKDCVTAYNTLTQVASYNAKWAEKGETVTIIKPVRNTGKKGVKNAITGMEEKKVVTNEQMHGVEFKLNDSVRGLDGFTDVLLPTNEDKWDGTFMVKGITKGEGGEAVKFDQQAQAAANPQEQNGQVRGGGTQFGTNNGTGEGEQPGPIPENGGPTGNQPGEQPSQGGGGKKGGGGTTTTSRPGTTTTTRPTTTTTNGSPTTTTTSTIPTTTTTSKGSEPGCVPNPPFVYCP